MKRMHWIVLAVLILTLTACRPTPKGYRAAGIPYEGQFCQLDQPFTIRGSGISEEVYTFTPTDKGGGSVNFTQEIYGCSVRATGAYDIEFFAGGEGDITMALTGTQDCASVLMPFETVLHLKIQQVDMPECGN